MEKAIVFLIAAVAIIAAILGIHFALWALWCWVLPQVWVSGPPALVAPGYWMFVACWTLAAAVGRAIFGGKSK